MVMLTSPEVSNANSSMLIREPGNGTVSKAEQPLNAYFSIVVRVPGSATDVSDLQSWNVDCGRLVIESGMDIASSPVSENTESPMEVKDGCRLMTLREEQPRKAWLPMLTMLECRNTDTSEVHS